MASLLRCSPPFIETVVLRDPSEKDKKRVRKMLTTDVVSQYLGMKVGTFISMNGVPYQVVSQHSHAVAAAAATGPAAAPQQEEETAASAFDSNFSATVD